MPNATITALLACLALTACGGEGNGDGANRGPSSEAETETEAGAESDKTFEGDGYSFSYPANWEERDPGMGFRFGTPTSETYIGLNNTDLLGVLRAESPVPITDANVDDYTLEFAAAALDLFAGNGGEMLQGPVRVTAGGLPGLRFEGWLNNVDDVRVESRVIWLFEKKTQYFMNCQYTPEHAKEMKQGCDQVEESFQVAQ